MRCPLRSAALGLLVAAPLALAGCRGQVSREPPIHPNTNMDLQEKYRAQAKNPFFTDNRATRQEVPGTVAVGSLADDDHLDRGLVAGQPARTLPTGLALDSRLLRRGRERFDIFCAPCHDRAGTGEGIVVKKGMLPPPRFTEPRLRAAPLGTLYTVIAAGIRNMPAYAAQIPVRDRWAIAAYVRALQLGRAATLADVPADVRQTKGWAP